MGYFPPFSHVCLALFMRVTQFVLRNHYFFFPKAIFISMPTYGKWIHPNISTAARFMQFGGDATATVHAHTTTAPHWRHNLLFQGVVMIILGACADVTTPCRENWDTGRGAGSFTINLWIFQNCSHFFWWKMQSRWKALKKTLFRRSSRNCASTAGALYLCPSLAFVAAFAEPHS